MRIIALIFCLLLNINGLYLFGQNAKMDSLRSVLSGKISDSLKVTVLNELAFALIHTDPSTAKDDVNLAINTAEQMNFLQGMARGYNVLGGVHWTQGNYPEALNQYLYSANLYEELDDKRGLATCYNNIGEIYKKLGDLDKSLEYLKRSIEVYSSVDRRQTYINIAEIHLQRGELNAAEEFLIPLLSTEKNKNDKAEAYIWSGLAQIALKRENYSKAEAYFYKAIEIREAISDYRGLADAYIHMGDLLKKQKLFDSSEIYYKKGLVKANQIEAKDLQLDAYMGLASVDSSQQDYKSALQNYIAFSSVKDSIFNKQKSEQINQLQAGYENELLKKENEANQIKVRQQTTVVIGVIMALILSIAMAIAFYRQRQIQHNANKMLARKNEDIEIRNKEIKAQAAQLKELNKSLESLNVDLEEEVRIRTKMLTKQNEVLSQYAYINAHELRAPVANILGLANLLQQTKLKDNEAEIVEHLRLATIQLDEVISSIRQELENSGEIAIEINKS